MTKTVEEIRSLLVAALTARQAAQPDEPQDNPLAHLGTRDLMHGKGVRTAADQSPARDMAAYLASKDEPAAIAAQIEQVRRAGLAAGKKDRSAARMTSRRARQARRRQIETLAKSPVMPDPERLAAAWEVVAPLSLIVEKIARSKQRWAERYLGSLTDDVAQATIESMVLVLARDERDLDVLVQAARELGGLAQRTGRVPGEQESKEQARERRAVTRGRKWLMGMVNNRVRGALADAYLRLRELPMDDLDILDTVLASIDGPGEDPAIARIKADRPPLMSGTRLSMPGRFDEAWLAAVINAAITARGLDRLVELLLDEERVRTDGRFMWAENAEAVFLATPDPWGRPSPMAGLKWTLVCQATAGHLDPRASRADAAREHVRNLFAFLPGVIVAAVEAFTPQVVHWRVFVNTDPAAEQVVGQTRALLHTPFDGLVREQPRMELVPKLVFASPHDAAEVLAEYLAPVTRDA